MATLPKGTALYRSRHNHQMGSLGYLYLHKDGALFRPTAPLHQLEGFSEAIGISKQDNTKSIVMDYYDYYAQAIAKKVTPRPLQHEYKDYKDPGFSIGTKNDSSEKYVGNGCIDGYDDEYCDDEYCDDEYCDDEYCDDEYCDDEYCDDEYCDDEYCDDEYCDDEYCDDEYCDDEYCDDEYCDECDDEYCDECEDEYCDECHEKYCDECHNGCVVVMNLATMMVVVIVCNCDDLDGCISCFTHESLGVISNSATIITCFLMCLIGYVDLYALYCRSEWADDQ
ncbi:hypothetical protein J3E74DRAFT_290512 [Bipolaris maydis]|nr:hypothetical protein J3E74DRAFT_290512 [Bipolaris maydis]